MKKLIVLLLLVSMTLGLTGCNYLDDLRAHAGYQVSENEIELNGVRFVKSEYREYYYASWDYYYDEEDESSEDDEESETVYPAVGMSMLAPILYGLDEDEYDDGEYYDDDCEGTIFDGPFETVWIADKDVPILLIRSAGYWAELKKDGSWLEYDGYYWFPDGKLPENFDEEYRKMIESYQQAWEEPEESEVEESEAPEEPATKEDLEGVS